VKRFKKVILTTLYLVGWEKGTFFFCLCDFVGSNFCVWIRVWFDLFQIVFC
jgi:hypothetical protein